jgi:hypothetical protein
MKSKKITPAALVALQDALTHIYWYKSDLRSFLTSVIENRAIVNFPNWDDRKRNIVRELVTYLARNEDQYQADLVRLIVEVCRMTDFSHLQRLEDGATKEQEARLAVQALRTHAASHIHLANELREAKKRRQESREKLERVTAVSERLDELKATYFALLADDDSNRRGYQLEKLLRDLFELFDLDPKASFRNTGEQIDGGFTFDGTDYLFEAKWQKGMVNAADLDTLSGKLSRKLDNTLGLFLSINGYSQDGVEAHASGKRVMLLMDGADLMAVLEKRIPLPDLLLRKRRHAAQTGEIYLRIFETL